jgi:hypothetical protein
MTEATKDYLKGFIATVLFATVVFGSAFLGCHIPADKHTIDTVRIVYPNLEAALNGMRNGDIIEVDRYDYQKASPIKLIRMDSISQVKESARQKYSDSINQIYLIRAMAHGQHCKCCMDSLIFKQK